MRSGVGVGVLMEQMMADGALHTGGMPVAAREIALPEAPAAWARLGFAVDGDGSFHVGGVRLVTGRECLGVAAEGLRADRPDGLAIVAAGDAGRASTSSGSAGPTRRSAAGGAAHPNGAVVLDHVVALTDSLPRTLAALEAAGLELRRIREPPEAPARQAFLRLGELILEVVERPDPPAALWGLVAVAGDLDALAVRLGGLLASPRDAVQPGRRIATVRREAGLATALAFMTPRPPQPQPGPSP